MTLETSRFTFLQVSNVHLDSRLSRPGVPDEYTGLDDGWMENLTAPFSSCELEYLGFSYACLGHCHDMTEVRTGAGKLLGPYSRSPFGRSIDEAGVEAVLPGSSESGRGGRCDCRLEAVEVARRRVVTVALDISGLTTQDMVSEISLSIEDQGGRPGEDIVYLHVEGNFRVGSDPSEAVRVLRQRYYDLLVDDCSRPDYLSERFDQPTTEGKFIATLLDLKRKADLDGDAESGITKSSPGASKFDQETQAASTGEGCDPSCQGGIIEDALYYGLGALKHKRINIRHVD